MTTPTAKTMLELADEIESAPVLNYLAKYNIPPGIAVYFTVDKRDLIVAALRT